MLMAAAGFVAPASAQSTDRPARESATVGSTVDFRSSKWLSDRKVVNANGEEIASVSDLILDRGWGRIEYLVVKTGTTLGMGGRAIAVPYGAFKWEAGKDRFVLASTKEQLAEFPEFSPETWTALKDSKKDDSSTLRKKLAADAASPSDPYAGNLDTAHKARVEGEIKKVERVRTSTFGEQVVVTVQTADGASKKIALGPSWYVNGTAAAPMRGDKVVVDTLALPRDPDQLLAATSLRTSDRGGGGELKLRETDGTPTWALKSVESGGQSYCTSYSRYLLGSHLTGMKVDCRGSECGKVHQVIIDRNSGEVGFISIDPNQNFMGISDTKRLIPWSVATVTLDGNMRIDASKEMVLASPETPGELMTLNSGTHAERVYKAFEVPAPRFETVKPVSAVLPGKDSAWSTHGPIITAIEKDSAKTLEGKVIDITEVKFEKGVQPARALKIKLPGDGAGEELVLVAPAWYLDNQKPICQTGDTVKVEACRTTIDGHRYWLAKAIDCKETRVVLLDGSNVPAWVQP
jgi:sporulation protein YlmC with PRC-barrel domain